MRTEAHTDINTGPDPQTFKTLYFTELKNN